ncbi:Hypothetical protein AA314_02186 [Archangium gephyra]|uniref:Uncharacterized protein n=1 Tax=Archangium gephyra TaxID=48 RepID=A0AAC8Q3T0_9BACT|nr:Hypothetical protein AA314_02186 [Archangium gephyra]
MRPAPILVGTEKRLRRGGVFLAERRCPERRCQRTRPGHPSRSRPVKAGPGVPALSARWP